MTAKFNIFTVAKKTYFTETECSADPIADWVGLFLYPVNTTYNSLFKNI